MAREHDPYDPIGFDGDNALFSEADGALLGMESPAPVDAVTDKAFERVSHYQDLVQGIEAELRAFDDAELGAAERKSALHRELVEAHASLRRLQVICQTVGAVSLQSWLHKAE